MHIDAVNLFNLTRLWSEYGAREVAGEYFPSLRINTDWPHRCWVDDGAVKHNVTDNMARQPVLSYTDGARHDNGHVLVHKNLAGWIDRVPESAVLPLWSLPNENGEVSSSVDPFVEKVLAEKGWRRTFTQLAMYKPLAADSDYSAPTRVGFQVRTVCTLSDLESWVAIGSEAFSYRIDQGVIEALLFKDNIQILLGCFEGEAISSALLYKTGDAIGVHQVGVRHSFQGKGFARSLMEELVARCSLWKGENIVLQASQMGKPLYERLGFREQFEIRNYQRI